MSRERSRRTILYALCGAVLGSKTLAAETPQIDPYPDSQRGKPLPSVPKDEDPRLPDGKSQKNAIAKEQHEKALKDADELVSAAIDLRDELRKAGMFVVPLNSVKRSEEIEKIAKRIRSRLKS